MNITGILAEKRSKNNEIKETFGLLKKCKPLGLIKISDKSVSDELIEGLKVLSWGFVIVHESFPEKLIGKNIFTVSKIDDSLIAGFDFVVWDENIWSLGEFSSKGVTPIMLRENHLGNILQEFNPLKNEGNSFFYDDITSWSVFYSIVRYLENYKFPFDNKNLVKNVLSI